MYLKKSIFLMVCIVVLFSSIRHAHAISMEPGEILRNGEISPQMLYIANANANIQISSRGRATVEAYVIGYSHIVTKTKVEADLQQLKNGRWTSIKTWSVSKNSYKTTLVESIQVSKGYSYRVVATVTAYSGRDSETQVITSGEVSY